MSPRFDHEIYGTIPDPTDPHADVAVHLLYSAYPAGDSTTDFLVLGCFRTDTDSEVDFDALPQVTKDHLLLKCEEDYRTQQNK